MLKKPFKHHAWFKGKTMTVKEFLDYVLSHSGDFTVVSKASLRSNNLFDDTISEYRLTDGRYSMRLDYQERSYLAEHSEYFASKLPPMNPNYMMAMIAANGEPIQSDHDVVYLSR